MKISSLEKLDLELYEETLDNGLKVYVVPRENVNGIYATFSTKFGSNETEFNNGKEMIKVPLGVAHFLEHKMFEQKDDKDPFAFYSERGCDANANTSNYKTTYLFSGANSFADNINYLLDYVQEPYFTDENVEKEKGIIIQEIKMYQDDPFMKMYDGIIYNLFIKHPIKYPIAGTKEDVNKTTKEDLYNCYNTFYHPSNMFLVITGNFDKDKALEIINNNECLKNCKTNHEIINKKIEESVEVKTKYIDTKMDVQSTRLNYSIKIPISDYKGIDRYKYVIYFGMMLNIMFGLASDFREDMLKNEYMTSFYYDRMYTNDYMIITFFALTETPEKLVEEIKKCLDNIKITKDDVERIKKVWISSEVMMIDDASLTLDNFVYDIIESGEVIHNKVDIFKEMNLEKLLNIVNNVDYNNSTTVIVRPQEEIL